MKQPHGPPMTLGNMLRLGASHSMRFCLSTLIAAALLLGSPALAYDPLDCLDDIARADPKIIVGLATKLCSGAWSPEPVKCYILADVDNEIPRGIAIDLCAGSTNAKNTISCYRKAMGDRRLIRALATTLCGAKKQER